MWTRSLPAPLRGSRTIGILNDVHIGIHDDPATRVVVEAMEHAGVDGLIANGDIHDCAAVSPHLGKRRAAVIETGQLAEEIAPGRWIVDWLATRPCIYGEGNHEDWINDLAIETNTVGTTTVASLLGLPVGPQFVVAPHGYEIRLGSAVVEHGDCIFPRSSGGQNLAERILRKYPNQTTIVGHFHREDVSVATSSDHCGVDRYHAAHCVGHLSRRDAHISYAGRRPNWQQGAAIVRLWEADRRVRFTVDHLTVHRDRRDRPVLEYLGRVFR